MKLFGLSLAATILLSATIASTGYAQEAEDPRIAELTAEIVSLEADLQAIAKENEELLIANDRLTATNTTLREQNAKRGWVMVRSLRRQVSGLRKQMRRMQPRFQTNEQRWSLMTDLYVYMDSGCVDGWDYNTSTSTSGSYASYSFSRWSTC